MTTTNRPKLICPKCGHEMNHHATKIDYSGDTPLLQEVHTCPNCKHIELRQAE